MDPLEFKEAKDCWTTLSNSCYPSAMAPIPDEDVPKVIEALEYLED
jgi:hypothetical protein